MATPATEARLLAVALSATAANVERLVRAWRRADRDAQPDAEQERLASRALSMQVDEDGMVVVRGRLPAEVGAVLMRAVEAALEQVPASADGGESTIAQRRADALGLVAESALAGGLDPGNSADRFQVTVHVQAGDTLAAREAVGDGKDPSTPGPATVAAAHVSAEIAPDTDTDLDAGLTVIEQVGGLHLGRETARRVGCDAGVVVLSHGADGEVLDVGRRTRTVPSALRRALHSRDRGQCQFPGCESRRCDAHHVEHWADGGATRLQNLVLACRFHHRALHEGGFRVVPGDADGQFRFLRPDGAAVAGGTAGAELGRCSAGADRRASGGGRHQHRPRHRHPRVVRRVAGPDGGARRAVGAAGYRGTRKFLTAPLRAFAGARPFVDNLHVVPKILDVVLSCHQDKDCRVRPSRYRCVWGEGMHGDAP